MSYFENLLDFHVVEVPMDIANLDKDSVFLDEALEEKPDNKVSNPLSDIDTFNESQHLRVVNKPEGDEVSIKSLNAGY